MYDLKKREEFANLIGKIDFYDHKSRQVFAEKILEEVRDRVASEDIAPLIAEVKTFPANAQAGFKYKRGLVAHVVEPGSYVPRSRPGQTVQLIVPMTVATAPEIELTRLESGDFESVEDLVSMAKDELIGKRTALIWNALDASIAGSSGALGGLNTSLFFNQADTAATKKAVLDDAITTVEDGPANVKAIIGRGLAVNWIQEIADYAETTKTERDAGMITRYRGIPIIKLKNYIDTFDQSRVGRNRLYVIGDDSIKVGFIQALRQLDGVDVDTATWHARIWEIYGILVLFPTHNVEVEIT